MAAINWAAASNGGTISVTSEKSKALFICVTAANAIDGDRATRVIYTYSGPPDTGNFYVWYIVNLPGPRLLSSIYAKYCRTGGRVSYGHIVAFNDGIEVWRSPTLTATNFYDAPYEDTFTFDEILEVDRIVFYARTSGWIFADFGYLGAGIQVFEIEANGDDSSSNIKIYDGAADVILAGEAASTYDKTRLRFYNGSAVIGLPLVKTTDSMASAVRICTDGEKGTVMAIREYSE